MQINSVQEDTYCGSRGFKLVPKCSNIACVSGGEERSCSMAHIKCLTLSVYSLSTYWMCFWSSVVKNENIFHFHNTL